MASKKKANAKKKASRRKQNTKSEKEYDDLPPLEEESKIEEIHDDDPELEMPKSHKPWSSLRWPADKIDRILKQLAKSHMLSESSIFEPKEAKDKAVVVVFKNDEDKFPSKVELKVSAFASTLMFMFSLTRKLCVPMPYWALFHGKQRLSGGEMISSFLKGSEGPPEFTVVQVVDVSEYLSPYEKEEQKKKSATESRRKLPADLSTIKKHSIEAFKLKEADIINANQVTQDQWKDYFVKRMALEERMEKFLKDEHQEDVEDSIINESRKGALRYLALKSNQSNANVSEQQKALFQQVTEGIYVWGKDLGWEDEDKLRDCSIYARVYSPFIIGNYIDFFSWGYDRARWSTYESSGEWSYVLGTLETGQDTTRVEGIRDEKPSKVRYIAKSNLDSDRDFEERYLISTKQLMKIQKHLFANKITLSPFRFFQFLFSASGVDYVDDYMQPFSGIHRLAGRSFECNPDSEEEAEEDRMSNVSTDAKDRENDEEDDEDGEEGYDDEEDEEFSNMQRNAILNMLMQQAMQSEQAHSHSHSHSRNSRGGSNNKKGSQSQPPNCPTQ